MRDQATERRLRSDPKWAAAMAAEEISWIAMCKKMRAAATRAHPDDKQSQNEVFETMRKQALGYYWRGPSEDRT